MVEPLLLTIKDTAQELNVSERTVHRMIKACELPFVRVRRAIRIPTTAVREWVEINTSLTDNGHCARSDARKGDTTCKSENPIEMGSTNVPTRRTTGPRTPMRAVDELGALLEFGSQRKDAGKQMHF